jgi:hypothetical protein
MTPRKAVLELTRLGFCFRLDGEGVRVGFEGEQPPDPAAVSPLLDLVRRHREDVHFFLRCHCPRCGGCCFAPDDEQRPRCLACDWNLLADASESGNYGKINEGEVPQAPPGEKIVRSEPRQLSLIEAEGWIYQEDQEAYDPPF